MELPLLKNHKLNTDIFINFDPYEKNFHNEEPLNVVRFDETSL